MQMKTLTVNGQTYTVTDPAALRETDMGGFVCADEIPLFSKMLAVFCAWVMERKTIRQLTG